MHNALRLNLNFGLSGLCYNVCYLSYCAITFIEINWLHVMHICIICIHSIWFKFLKSVSLCVTFRILIGIAMENIHFSTRITSYHFIIFILDYVKKYVTNNDSCMFSISKLQKVAKTIKLKTLSHDGSSFWLSFCYIFECHRRRKFLNKFFIFRNAARNWKFLKVSPKILRVSRCRLMLNA